MIEIRAIEPGDREALIRFFARIPEGDRTFFKEDVGGPDVVAAWAQPGAARAIAVEGAEVVGSVAVVTRDASSCATPQSSAGRVSEAGEPNRRCGGGAAGLLRWVTVIELTREVSAQQLRRCATVRRGSCWPRRSARHDRRATRVLARA